MKECKHEWGKPIPQGEKDYPNYKCSECGIELDCLTRRPVEETNA